MIICFAPFKGKPSKLSSWIFDQLTNKSKAKVPWSITQHFGEFSETAFTFIFIEPDDYGMLKDWTKNAS